MIMKKIMSYALLEGTGESWDDLPRYQTVCDESKEMLFPQRIHMWNGQFLDKIQVSYNDTPFDVHGGSEPGGETDILLDKGEYVTKVDLNYMPWGRSNYMIRDLTVYTSNGRKCEFHSWADESTGMKHVEYAIPDGFALVALGGKTDHYNPEAPCCISGIVLHYMELSDKGAAEPIIVNETTTITLDNVSINATADTPAITVNENVKLTLKVKGANTLTSETSGGIVLKNGASVHIIGDSKDSSRLTVKAGSDRENADVTNVGIGTDNSLPCVICGDITIENVTLVVSGGENCYGGSAAIGTGTVRGDNPDGQTCGNITIRNSDITAISGKAAAAIGVGRADSEKPNALFSVGDIIIENSSVRATALKSDWEECGASIGLGVIANAPYKCGKVRISGCSSADEFMQGLDIDVSGGNYGFKIGKGGIEGTYNVQSVFDGVWINDIRMDTGSDEGQGYGKESVGQA